MNPIDPRLPVPLEAALNQIRTTTATVASRLCDSLGTTASTTTQTATRDAVNLAQDELRRNLDLFGRTFYDALREKGYSKEKAARIANAQAAGTIDHHKGQKRKAKRGHTK